MCVPSAYPTDEQPLGLQGKAATVLHSVASSPDNSDSIADLWAAVGSRKVGWGVCIGVSKGAAVGRVLGANNDSIQINPPLNLPPSLAVI